MRILSYPNLVTCNLSRPISSNTVLAIQISTPIKITRVVDQDGDGNGDEEGRTDTHGRTINRPQTERGGLCSRGCDY
jgi:hypothetical protein